MAVRPALQDYRPVVGATGFEPATSRPPALRANQLRYAPKPDKFYIKNKPKAILIDFGDFKI